MKVKVFGNSYDCAGFEFGDGSVTLYDHLGNTVASFKGLSTFKGFCFYDGTIIIAAAAITGTPTVGQVLTAEATYSDTPDADPTLTYQWQICDTVDGTYSDITNATDDTYTILEADEAKFIKVEITATGSVTGTLLSEATSAIEAAISMTATITGTATVGEVLTANVSYSETPDVNPTLAYQWKVSDTADGAYTDISGATSATYTILEADATKFIKVSISATGSVIGTALSASTTAVSAA